MDDYDTNNGVSVKVETIPRTEFVTLSNQTADYILSVAEINELPV